VTARSRSTAAWLAGAGVLAVALVLVGRCGGCGAGAVGAAAGRASEPRPVVALLDREALGAGRHAAAESPGRFDRPLSPVRVRLRRRVGEGGTWEEHVWVRGTTALVRDLDDPRGTLWLGRNPRDPERLHGEWLPATGAVVVALTESDLRREFGSGRFSGVAGFGVTPRELAELVPTGETEEAFGAVFGRWVRLDAPPGDLVEVWWSDELALPLRWTGRLEDGRALVQELLGVERLDESTADPAPLHVLHPERPRRDLADVLEEE